MDTPRGGSPSRPLSTFRFFDDRNARLALALLVVLPSAYVWLLPLLATEEIQFAHRCEGYPRCDGRFAGVVTVGDYLGKPQATGAYAAVFFWPAFHMWSIKDLISQTCGQHIGLLIVLAFYCGFGLTLAVPITASRTVYHLASVAMLACVLGCFSLLLWRFRHRRLVCFKVLLAIAVLSTGLCCLWLGALLLKHALGRDNMPAVPAIWPWIAYVPEATSLSCVSLLPWFWKVGDEAEASDPGTHAALGSLSELASWTTSRDTLVVLRSSRSPLRFPFLALAAAPAAYVWLLPLLAKLGFARECEGLPRCTDSSIGASVSNFIATPQATGAMAAVFFWPLAHIWSHKGEIDGTRSFAVLLTFYAFFGSFLACPVTVYPRAHSVVVGMFCFTGLLYFRGLLDHCREATLFYCRVLLRLSVAAFAGVVLLSLVTFVGKMLGKANVTRDDLPWAFYICEATGLSCMSLFPWCWQVRHHSRRAPSAF